MDECRAIRQYVRVSKEAENWSARHFSLANALDDRPIGLSHLLRRVADEIDARGISAMEILDVTVSHEMTADGPWWSVSVYWSPGGGADG